MPTLPLRRGSRGDAVKAWQLRLNRDGEALEADGAFGPATERATVVFQLRRLIPATGCVDALTKASQFQEPRPTRSLPLGHRRLLWMLEQMRLGMRAAPYPQPNTSPFVAEIFGPCVREDEDGELVKLGLSVGNWCCAAASASIYRTIRDDEEAPHYYRAAVIEAVADARKLDRYFPVEDVRNGIWRPEPGDAVIWDRSTPGDPSTAWMRHVNLACHYDTQNTITITDDVFSTVGGNEARAFQLTSDRPKRLDSGKLLGFICSRQRLPSDPVHPLTDEERATLEAEITAARAAMAREAVSRGRGAAQ